MDSENTQVLIVGAGAGGLALSLLLAGLVAGAMNAVAGGGTFVTLPALTLAGLSPTVANASNTVALFPGTLASSWAYRREMRHLEGVSSATLLIVSMVGGLIGALLLLSTPQGAFSRIVPWLLLAATVALSSGPRFGQALRAIGCRMGRRSLLIAQFALGVYGGYFGGAVGLMMMAVWTVFTTVELRSVIPLRALMVAAANGVAVVCFAIGGNVGWPETLLVMTGAVVGGYVGAHFGKRLPALLLRVMMVVITTGTTAAFFLRWIE
jgi:uncharacterized protein